MTWQHTHHATPAHGREGQTWYVLIEIDVPAGPAELIASVVPVRPRWAVMLVLSVVLLAEMIDQPPADSALS